MTTIIKKVTLRGRHFTMVKDDNGYYCCIEDKYIDKDGRLTQTLNGIQVHASKTLATCYESTKDAVEIDYLRSTGLSKDEAFNAWLTAKQMVLQA